MWYLDNLSSIHLDTSQYKSQGISYPIHHKLYEAVQKGAGNLCLLIIQKCQYFKAQHQSAFTFYFNMPAPPGPLIVKLEKFIFSLIFGEIGEVICLTSPGLNTGKFRYIWYRKTNVLSHPLFISHQRSQKEIIIFQ